MRRVRKRVTRLRVLYWLLYKIKDKKPNPPYFCEQTSAQHTPASRILLFHIPDFLHRISDYSILQPYFLKITNFHPDLASSDLCYIFILMKCPVK